MNKFYFIFLLSLLSYSSFSQDNCDSAVPFCNDFGSPETVVNGGSAEVGPDYGCLASQPNPSWSLLKIQSAGDMELEISQIDNNGVGIDVDFICYGPFNDPITPCQNGILTAMNTIGCSYSSSSIEHLTINNAQVGEYYLILITNYDGTQGTLTFTQTNTTSPTAGESDCSIVCNVTLGNDRTVCIDSEYELTTTLGNSSIDPTYKWFKNGVEIVGEVNNTYTVHSNTITTDIYKVEINSDICDEIADDEIVITYVDIISNLKLNDITKIDLCDNDNDGFDTFDLRVNELEIANTENVIDYTFTYFTDSALTQQINNPATYNNTTGYTETVYVSVKHNTFVGCVGVTHFEINAIDSPIATQLEDWLFCDDNNDGFYTFDLESLKTDIYNGQDVDKYDISFYHTQDDANDSLNPLPLNYINADAYLIEEIFIRIENNEIATCFETSSFNIQVIRTPVANQIPNWIVCDDADNDGFYTFDLESLKVDLLNGQDETEIDITFYKSVVDVEFKLTPLDLNYINKEAFVAEEIFVRMESVDKSDCYNYTSFFIQVIENPIFDIVEDTQYICVNLLSQTVDFEIENMQGNYTYSWQDDNGVELSTNTIFQATQAGDYTITATTNDGNNCSTTKTIHLLPSAPATNIEFVVKEYWQEENFSIEVSVMGNGVYQYAIDNINGPYQEEPLLINVVPGVHTVYVKEMNNCGITSKIIDVFGFSPFFTPNGDGKHDIWKVQGINFKTTAKIYIFDRYGKLMSQFQPALNQGWNGFYNGKPAPEGEYWFTSDMTDYKGESIIRKGHFSLLRTNN